MPSPGRSVFVTLEDSEATLSRRVKAWLQGIYELSELRAAEHAVRKNFSYLDRRGARALTLTETRDGSTVARMDVAEHVARMTEGADFIVLETVAKLSRGAPENSEGYGALVQALEHIVITTGAALVVVQHTSKKDAGVTSPEEVTSRMGRGSVALSDSVRSSLIVTRPSDDPFAPVSLTLTKATHARTRDTLTWVPVLVPDLHCCRLEHRSAELQAADEGAQLLAYLATKERGVTRRELRAHPPKALGRERAMQALDLLRARGQVEEHDERRGRTGQHATVYHLPANAPGHTPGNTFGHRRAA